MGHGQGQQDTPLDFFPSFWGFLFGAGGSTIPTREARENLRVATAPKLQPGLERGPVGRLPGHSEGGVYSAGPPGWLFWLLPGLCQIPAFPRTNPKGPGGNSGPHFLPGEINQLSNRPDT